MKSTFITVAGGLVLASALAAPALAERGKPSYYEPPTFSDLDQNRSGKLDLGEIQGRTPLAGEFRSYDKNDDGRIDRSEFAAFEADETLSGQMPQVTPAEPATPGTDRAKGGTMK
jgi:hypothetical protein